MMGTALIVHLGVAEAAWTVDASGNCVEHWTSADLLRGPTAIVNAPLLPFRASAGGAVYAWHQTEWWPAQIVGLGPAVTLLAGAAGVVESVWWIGTGLADTLTGGYFAIAPEKATQLSISPELPGIIADAKPAPELDPCGRPVPAKP